MGVDMVSMANNHSTDFGPEGLMETIRLADEAGLANSGGGANMKEAREAGFLDTPKGRIGLVSTASTFKPNAGANDAFGETNARPGISILRLKTINLVNQEQLENFPVYEANGSGIPRISDPLFEIGYGLATVAD